MKRLVREFSSFPAFIVVLISLLLLGACSSEVPNSSSDSLGEIDALGSQIALQEPAQTVVTIAPGATEIVYAAGGLDRLIGVSNVDSYPEEVLSLPLFSVLPLDIEAIAAMDPDLIIASDQVNDPKDADIFEMLGIPIFYLKTASWKDVKESIGITGRLLGSSEIAAASMDSLEVRVQLLRQATANISDKPTAIMLVSAVTSYSFGPGSYVLDIMEWAGVTSLTQDAETAAPNLSDEFVLASDPDMIFGTFGTDFELESILEHHPSWRTLSAYKNGHIYSIEGDLILRPGPRNVDAAYQMALMAHPNLDFSDRSSLDTVMIDEVGN